ncbi:hypothetical protein GCM10027610_001650 [Dactylosporangium cerinum]
MVGGDDRDGLTRVADLAHGEHRLVGVFEAVQLLARDVLGGEHGVHAGGGDGAGEVDPDDPGPGVRAAQGRAPQHPVGPQVGGERELAGDLQRPVRPQRRRADARAGAYRGGHRATTCGQAALGTDGRGPVELETVLIGAP